MRRKLGTALVVAIVLLVLAGTVARLFLIALAEPHHMGMAPAVLNGDNLLLWRAGTPGVGDVIVYAKEAGGATQAIGRVLAVGPTSIEIAAGGMPVRIGDADVAHAPSAPDLADGDGVLGGRAYALETLPGGRAFRVILPEMGGKGPARAPRTEEVPAGAYYVLNDNRGAPEADSRTLGPIPADRVIGIARWFVSGGPYGTPGHEPGLFDPVL